MIRSFSSNDPCRWPVTDDEWNSYLAENYARIMRVAANRVGHISGAAEDVAQDICMKLWELHMNRRDHEKNGKAHISYYIVRMIINKCFDIFRKYDTAYDETPDRADPNRARDMLAIFYESLNDKHRAFLNLLADVSKSGLANIDIEDTINKAFLGILDVCWETLSPEERQTVILKLDLDRKGTQASEHFHGDRRTYDRYRTRIRRIRTKAKNCLKSQLDD